MTNSESEIFVLVRNPDKQKTDAENGVEEITRRRLLENFSETPENLIQEGAVLVRHPYLHPKFEAKLLPAQKLYDALREEAELEFCEALMELGATEIILTYSTNKTQASKMKTGAELGIGAFGSEGSIKNAEEQACSGEKTWKMVLGKQKVDISALDEGNFFSKLVYNKNNQTLRILFNQIKSGKEVKKFELEFKHSVSRNHKLEAKIKASYLALFSLSLDFEKDYKENEVESASFVAKF